ncbi:MAG: CDP-diacylglycerol--serine O-phosphatidyltransferase [Proteobacteria bacterium]|nr:CDP-diacylglycerol--serine O-phosphatidyltransferase [Pseudomonadota bacterium]
MDLRTKNSSKRFKGRLKNRFRDHSLKSPTFFSILPNIITILALCSGLSAIRFALIQKWEWAVTAILLAAFLDMMDGRLARLLGSSSRFGAELDSLADFVDFGIAPAFIVYFYSLHEWGTYGWSVILFYSICMALRLARFNTLLDENTPLWAQGFFTGVPAPVAAILALSLIVLDLHFDQTLSSTLMFAFVMVSVGLLKISRIPTFSMKKVKIPHKFILPFLLFIVITVTCAFSAPWLTYLIVVVIYLLLIPLSILKYRALEKQNTQQEPNE